MLDVHGAVSVREVVLCKLPDGHFTPYDAVVAEEVMNHISQANERAAVTMKAEIRLERQRTIYHLRGRCKSRLRQILHMHIEQSVLYFFSLHCTSPILLCTIVPQHLIDLCVHQV